MYTGPTGIIINTRKSTNLLLRGSLCIKSLAEPDDLMT
jgi:hypothetical protein